MAQDLACLLFSGTKQQIPFTCQYLLRLYSVLGLCLLLEIQWWHKVNFLPFLSPSFQTYKMALIPSYSSGMEGGFDEKMSMELICNLRISIQADMREHGYSRVYPVLFLNPFCSVFRFYSISSLIFGHISPALLFPLLSKPSWTWTMTMLITLIFIIVIANPYMVLIMYQAHIK
jgi:hypothetical protein